MFICYGWQQVIHLFSRVPIFWTWAIAQVITYMLLPILKLCVMNQSVGYWLFKCITVKVDAVKVQALNQLLICGNFNSKL
jgi:hypothetical protein